MAIRAFLVISVGFLFVGRELAGAGWVSEFRVTEQDAKNLVVTLARTCWAWLWLPTYMLCKALLAGSPTKEEIEAVGSLVFAIVVAGLSVSVASLVSMLSWAFS